MTTIYKQASGEIICASQQEMQETALAAMLSAGGLSYISGFYPPDTFYISDGEPKEFPVKEDQDSQWCWETKHWVIDDARKAVSVILKRNALLASTDWTQLPDVPEGTKDRWLVYRQALRDITDQPGFPLLVIWPIQPL